MMRAMISFTLLALMAAAGAPGAHAQAAKQVLIVTGQDYPGHKWPETAPVLAASLRRDARFEVSVNEDPACLAQSLDKYDVIVLHFMNWEQPDPGAAARENLRAFVEGGKGLCLVHFACGAFQDWPEFRNLAGRAWDPKMRPHDPFGSFRVEIRKPDHPIMAGMEAFTTPDELYTCLAGDYPIDVLATAKSSVDGADYAMAFTSTYGKGRVFHTPLGHDAAAFANPPVGELIRRGCAWTANLEPAARPRQIALLAGENSHQAGEHRHVEGMQLLKQALEACGTVQATVHEHAWPADPAVLDSADCIVVYSDGFEGHPLFAPAERRPLVQALMDRGVGLVCIHFAVAPPRDSENRGVFMNWMGGCYVDKYSMNPVAESDVAPVESGHPITRGMAPFRMLEEFYYRLQFARTGVTPILAGMLPADAPARETIAWAYTRPNGGRSFGFTGGHFHKSWDVAPYRTMVLNAILWAAGAPVPAEGAGATK